MSEEVKGCYLYSKANYSIKIKYNGDTIMLPPFATRFKIADQSKLGVLPDKVRKVTIGGTVNTNKTSIKVVNKQEDGGKK